MIIKLSEENTEVNIHDCGLGNDFLDMTAKAQAMKEKIKNFCAAKDIIRKVKRHPTD